MKILVLISFNSVLKSSLDVFSGGSREGAQGARPLLIFRPKWGPMGRKRFLWGRPSHPLISGCGWPGPPLSKGLDLPLVFTHKQYASVELGSNMLSMRHSVSSSDETPRRELKYDVQQSIFDELRGGSSGDETLCRMLDIIAFKRQTFLLAHCRWGCWGRFARRNVCVSVTQIPYWWR